MKRKKNIAVNTYEWKSTGAFDIAAMYSAKDTLLSPDVSARLKKA